MDIFARFYTAVVKVNFPKCSFGLKYITYLGYIFPQEGLKPDTKNHKESWISGNLPQRLKREHSLGRSSTTGTRASVGHMYYLL